MRSYFDRSYRPNLDSAAEAAVVAPGAGALSSRPAAATTATTAPIPASDATGSGGSTKANSTKKRDCNAVMVQHKEVEEDEEEGDAASGTTALMRVADGGDAVLYADSHGSPIVFHCGCGRTSQQAATSSRECQGKVFCNCRGAKHCPWYGNKLFANHK
jgi:rhodanese-related sulfurtransferase